MIFWLNSEGNDRLRQRRHVRAAGLHARRAHEHECHTTPIPNMPKPWNEHWERMKQKRTVTSEG